MADRFIRYPLDEVPYNNNLNKPTKTYVVEILVEEQVTPASSCCLQLCLPKSSCLHCHMDPSSP